MKQLDIRYKFIVLKLYPYCQGKDKGKRVGGINHCKLVVISKTVHRPSYLLSRKLIRLIREVQKENTTVVL